MRSLSIFSWNILHGGGSRCEQIQNEIADTNPDILTLQEFRRGRTGNELLHAMEQLGYGHVYAPETENARQNTLVIASRYPIQCETFPTEGECPARGIIGRIDVTHSFSLNIVALHLPHKKAQVRFFESLLDLPDSWTSGHSLIVGDLNCGIPFEDSQTRTFYATHMFQRLLANGWVDSWRQRHPDCREFSWVSTRQGNGFRYDHVLSSNNLDKLIDSVSYDHTVRERKISDHSSMLVRLSF